MHETEFPTNIVDAIDWWLKAEVEYRKALREAQLEQSRTTVESEQKYLGGAESYAFSECVELWRSVDERLIESLRRSAWVVYLQRGTSNTCYPWPPARDWSETPSVPNASAEIRS